MAPLCIKCRHHKKTPLLGLNLCERTRRNVGGPDPVTGRQDTRVDSCEDERRARLFSRKHCGPSARFFEAA